ncbi:MAG: DegV family protein [Lachnospiraceae bacterium]|nr:DegV family protein [Lachnospiraceae bacterium]
MSSYVLTCCSTVDLPKEYFEKNNIPYACYHYMMDGEEYLDDLGESIPYDEFYKRIAAGSMPTTSQINISEFMAFFEPFLQEGKDIIHISMSSGISGTCNSALNAKEELLAKYPERTIKVVDSLAASSGYGLFLDKLVEMRDEGKSLEELYLFAEDYKLKLQHWFFSTDLTHFKRGGRISATAATLGNILNLCPLMNVDYMGKLIVRQKIRGKKKVIAEIVNKMIELAEGGKDYNGKCFISCSACEDDAKKVADLVEETFPNLNGKVEINSIGAVIGAHTGPGTVALFFWGEKRVN